MGVYDDVLGKSISPTPRGKVGMDGSPAEQGANVLAGGSGGQGMEDKAKVGANVVGQPEGWNKVADLGQIYDVIDRRTEQRRIKEEDEASRKARATALIMGLGDGISALTNLYYTTKGSPAVNPSSALGKYQKTYEEAKAKREVLREQWRARMEDVGKDELFYNRRKEEIRENREREDSQRVADKAERTEVRGKTWEREDARDLENRRQYDQQYEFNVKQADKTQKNTKAGMQFQKERLNQQDRKERQSRVYQFNKAQGEVIPFVLGDKTYAVGSKALANNVGNIVAGILEDIRTTQFKGLDEKKLSKNMDWIQIRRSLDPAKMDVKKLSEVMKQYAKYSPSAVAMVERLSDYYQQQKYAAENGFDDSSLGLGWESGGDDSLGLGWTK